MAMVGPWCRGVGSAAGRGLGRFGLGLCCGSGAAAADVTTLVSLAAVEQLGAGAERLGVGQHGVDLPFLAGRAGDPDLVLGGKTTGGADLLVGEQAFAGQSGDLGVHLVAGFHLDTEVVDGAALAGVFQQHQLQRRLGHREVGVTGLHLGRGNAKQFGVERDRLVEIVDVER